MSDVDGLSDMCFILFKGYECLLMFIKYNCEGDLLFMCVKDYYLMLWYGDNGECVGMYVGYNGVVWMCDVSDDLLMFVIGSVDMMVKLWDMKMGECYFTFEFD